MPDPLHVLQDKTMTVTLEDVLKSLADLKQSEQALIEAEEDRLKEWDVKINTK